MFCKVQPEEKRVPQKTQYPVKKWTSTSALHTPPAQIPGADDPHDQELIL